MPTPGPFPSSSRFFFLFLNPENRLLLDFANLPLRRNLRPRSAAQVTLPCLLLSGMALSCFAACFHTAPQSLLLYMVFKVHPLSSGGDNEIRTHDPFIHSEIL